MRARLLNLYFNEHLYFERPFVPSFLRPPLDANDPLDPSMQWRPPGVAEKTRAEYRLHGDIINSATFLELLWGGRRFGPIDEYVYRLGVSCELYTEHARELRERGLPLSLRTPRRIPARPPLVG
mmetsp:Transcript_35136/g.75001  ORF Transcript_35136/g.75001 Transcript_35136/m.75001 type:complete len:124 (-) Transcript_35136:476-847(-)